MSPTEPSTAAAAAAERGAVVRVPSDDAGGDPLVRVWLETRREACAWRTISWAWIVIGAIASIVGGVVGSHLGGPVRPLADDFGAFARLLNQHFGHPGACVVGMIVGAAVASTVGVRARPRGVPAGQEPWIGAAVVCLAYLFCFDRLVCLGVFTGALCLVYFLALSFRALAVWIGGHQGLRSESLTEPPGGWPTYTVLVPLYKERNVARNILVSLGKLDYPRERLDVKFLLEADDPETLQALEQAGVPPWAEVVVVPPGQPKTKPRACNHGLARARGEFLVIFDAEDRPDPDQLKQAAIAFLSVDKNVVCLQAQLAYHNHAQNLLTRWFALEYNVWFRRYLGGLVRLGVPIPLGGTSNHFRTKTLHEVGGWDPFNVTEDCDLGVRLYVARHRTLTLDSTTWEEANSRVGNWIRQRSRWLKGYLITHLVWARRPFLLVGRLGPWGAFGFLLSVFCVGALAALNLGLWFALSIQIAFLAIDLRHGYTLHDLLFTRDLDHERWSWPMVYMGHAEDPVLSTLSQVFFAAAVCLLLGNLLFVLIALLAGRRPGQNGLWWAALLTPVYWVLISIAAWKGVWQLLVKPHFWEKTVHGLDQPGEHGA
jgi:cellulose synthase/poly-beta-1,6-N-acetylglucosamine synthase-like glycosyltransferase